MDYCFIKSLYKYKLKHDYKVGLGDANGISYCILHIFYLLM